MKVETFLLALFAATVVAVAVVVAIVTNLSPQDAGFFGLGALFVSLFATFVGATTLTGYFARRRLRHASGWEAIGASLRQGVLASVSAVALLVLQALRVLTLLSGILLVIAIFSGEIYLRGRVRR